MTVGKVSNFNFSSAGKTVGRCNDSMTKMASGGYYSKGGSAKAGQDVQMAKSNAVAKSLVGQKTTPYAKGGIKEAATGEMYPSRSAMMKHESMETPRMQREEVMQSRTVKAPPVAMAAARQGPPTPMRRQMPVAPTAPMIQPGGMKKGGFVKGGTGMVKTEGTLGIKGNKNPGEKNGKPTTATKAGNVHFKKGGEVNKYAVGGPATQTGALNQMAAAQQRPALPSQIARQQAVAASRAQQAKPPVPQPQQMQGQPSGIEAYMRQMQGQPQQNMGVPPQQLGGGVPAQSLGAQLSPNQMQQQLAAFNAARGQQGMPGGQQAPQAQQQAMSQMPPQMAAYAQQNMGQSALQQGLGQSVPQQGLGQPLGTAQGNPGMQQYMQQLQGAQPMQMPGGPQPMSAIQQAPSMGAPSTGAPPQQQGMGQALSSQRPMPTQQGMQQQSQFNVGGIGQYAGAGMGKFS